jgi:hypothetical protein
VSIFLSALLLSPAFAYGESEDGLPTWSQRELHTVTNLVRVDPMAWSGSYDCSTIQFKSSEKQPKAPLLFHRGLTEIAQLHSDDMKQNKFMDHDSSDGTDFGDRVWPYYDGTSIGENVAVGYADNWEVVLEGWMCSSGHRVNIMAEDFEDMGTGITGKYYTQDFGGGADSEHEPLAMGVHSPRVPKTGVSFFTTWLDNQAPASLLVETDTVCEPMVHFLGDPEAGGYKLEMDEEAGCVPYRFLYEESSGQTGALPTTGAWVYGKNCELWTEVEPEGCTPPEPEPEPEEEDCDLPEELDRNGDCVEDSLKGGGGEKRGILGCASVPGSGGSQPWGLLGLILLVMGRRDQDRLPKHK